MMPKRASRYTPGSDDSDGSVAFWSVRKSGDLESQF